MLTDVPRKRAKTDDEKEQRRIERVLRNRAAAQTSRERKRLEVKKIEDEKKVIELENTALMERLDRMEAENNRLNEKIAKLSRETPGPSSNASPRGAAPLPTSGSPTLTPILFKRENDYGHDAFAMDRIPFSTPLSIDESTAEPSDLTQHPAAVLCDLQCQSEASTAVTSMMRHTLALQIIIAHHVFLMMTSAAYSTVILPMSQIFHSLKEGSPLTFSREEISRHLPLILWLLSTPTLLRPIPTASGQRSVFRMRLLARLLDCRPAMARPLKDATSLALQLALREMTISGATLASATRTRDVKDWRLLVTMMWAIERVGPKQRPRRETRSIWDRYIHGDGKRKQFLTKRRWSLRFGTKRA